jgi:sirohydrochlorin cobaltochelatase
MVYDEMEAEVRAAHPDHPLRWAWTARSLVARLRAQGEAVQTLDEALASLSTGGFTQAALLSLHLVPGEKHHEILAADSRGLRLTCGKALLETSGDLEGVAAELLAELPQDRPVLVVAHGHAHEARFNAELKALGTLLAAARPDVFLTRLEGDDDPGGLDTFIKKAQSVGRVHVVPFLLVAGDHVASDILGEEPDSLRSRMAIADFTCGPPLGQRAFVRRRFLARLDAVLAALESA